jgi:hypothetical protein
LTAQDLCNITHDGEILSETERMDFYRFRFHQIKIHLMNIYIPLWEKFLMERGSDFDLNLPDILSNFRSMLQSYLEEEFSGDDHDNSNDSLTSSKILSSWLCFLVYALSDGEQMKILSSQFDTSNLENFIKPPEIQQPNFPMLNLENINPLAASYLAQQLQALQAVGLLNQAGNNNFVASLPAQFNGLAAAALTSGNPQSSLFSMTNALGQVFSEPQPSAPAAATPSPLQAFAKQLNSSQSGSARQPPEPHAENPFPPSSSQSFEKPLLTIPARHPVHSFAGELGQQEGRQDGFVEGSLEYMLTQYDEIQEYPPLMTENNRISRKHQSRSLKSWQHLCASYAIMEYFATTYKCGRSKLPISLREEYVGNAYARYAQRFLKEYADDLPENITLTDLCSSVTGHQICSSTWSNMARAVQAIYIRAWDEVTEKMDVDLSVPSNLDKALYKIRKRIWVIEHSEKAEVRPHPPHPCPPLPPH